MSTTRRMPATIRSTSDEQHDGVGGGRRILQQRHLVLHHQRRPRRSGRRDMTCTVEKSRHHQRHHEDRADRHAGLGQRDDDVPQDLPAARAGVARRLDQRAVDAHQRVEDRRHHEQRVEVHHGQHDGEIGDRAAIRSARSTMPSVDQRRVDQPVAAEHRDPRDHADDVGGQERHGADEEQHHLHRRRADVEGEEIGDPEADEERQRPDDDRVFQRVEIGLPGDPRAERVGVVGQR